MKARFILYVFFFLYAVQLNAQHLWQSVDLVNQEYAVLFQDSAQVTIYDESGASLYNFGGWGTSDLNLDQPIHLSVQSGLKLLITDIGKQKILVLDRRLQRIAEYQFDSFSPLVSFFAGFERILTIGDSFSEWRLIDSRSGEFYSILPELPNGYEPSSQQVFRIADDKILIAPDLHDSSKRWLVYDYEGVFLNWVVLPDTINTFKSTSENYYYVRDRELYRIRKDNENEEMLTEMPTDFFSLHSVNDQYVVYLDKAASKKILRLN